MISNTTEIRISDMLAMLLKAFKRILCLVLILVFLGAAYGAFSFAKERPQVTQEDIEIAEQEVARSERALALAQNSLSFRKTVAIPGAQDKVERIERMILQLQDYTKSSIYYRMNPFHRGAARLRFAVEPNDTASTTTAGSLEDSRTGIVIAYTQMYPFDLETVEQVLSIMDIEASVQYINELISITSDENYHTVEVCVFYDDLHTAEQVVGYLYDTITVQAKETMPVHQVTILTTYTGYEADWSLNEKQVLCETSLADAEKALLEANESYDTLRKQKTEEEAVTSAVNDLNAARKDLKNAKYSYSNNLPSLQNIARRAIRFGVIGGVVGLLLGSFFALAAGLFGGIIQNQNEVISRYSFPLIGILPRAKKVWFNRSIQKLEGEPIGDANEITQATVQSLLSRVGERSVCLISTSNSAAVRKLAAYTDDRVKVLDSITNSAEAVKEIAKYDGIVLVEERGKSRIDLVDVEVLRAQALNKEILGIVLA